MGSEDDDKDQFADSQKIILAAIFSLFAVVILVILLHLYSRYLFRRQERRRRAALYRQSRQIAPADMESNYTIEPPKVGLDPLVIASFPPVAYKPTNQQELDHGEPMECSVCLGTIVEDAMVRVLPNCKHMFHVECIDMWLGSNTTCPICRTVAEPRVPPEGSEVQVQVQVQPSAPPLASGSGSLFGSFRWMVSRDRSSRARSCGDEVSVEDSGRQ